MNAPEGEGEYSHISRAYVYPITPPTSRMQEEEGVGGVCVCMDITPPPPLYLRRICPRECAMLF